MNINTISQLEAELILMDLNDIKPNYAELGRKYGLDYRTVKKYHQGYQGKPKTRDKPSKLDNYKEVIVQKLEIPRNSRKSVYEFLVDKYGVELIGSYSNFKIYCRKNKLKPNNDSTGGNTRFETEPGDMAQCDWKESVHLISKNGEVFIVNIFHLVLKFSRYSYLEITLSKEQTTVFRCLINAFRYYGGVPERILFDNMSSVVDVSVRPKRINNKMIQFSKDLNFKVQTCRTRHAYTKGTNESRNKIIDWIRSYNDEFDTFSDLQNIVERINIKMNTEICEGTNLPPCLLFYKEKEHLNPMPDSAVMDQYIAPTKVIVSPQQLITYKGVKYSVDRSYIGEYVQPEEFNNKLQIYYKGKLIQIHQLSKNPINYTENHYMQSLEKVVKQENIENVALSNLKTMDSLLEKRTVTVTKDDAVRSHEALVAYLVTHGALSNWIRRFIQSLSKEERIIFYDELTKMLPYVINEEQFFEAFKHAAQRENIHLTRVYFWGLDILGNYEILSEEGHESICRDFEKDTKEYLLAAKEDMEERNK